jgi:hypothetical protein
MAPSSSDRPSIAFPIATSLKRRIPFEHFFANLVAFFRAQSFNVPFYAGRKSIHVISDQMIRRLLCSEMVFGRQIRLNHMQFIISKFERYSSERADPRSRKIRAEHTLVLSSTRNVVGCCVDIFAAQPSANFIVSFVCAHFFAFSPSSTSGGGWNLSEPGAYPANNIRQDPNCVSLRVNYCRFAVDG